MTIPNLNSSDTFKGWFDRTNTIIAEVNGITIHDLRAGDGMGVTSSSNVFTVSHGSLVATGVTFTGPVNFTNSVAFNISPTIDATVVTISPKTAGITIGNVVRMAGSGLTLAKADSAENAEVLGVVVSDTSTANIVAVSGSVNNKLFNNTISNALGIAGGTLGIGCAYFLDPVVAGGITNIEPVTYGQVSKPVILGISAGAGSILPYRGIQIEGISAGITAELDNKIIIQFDTDDLVSGALGPNFGESGNPIKLGDIFTMSTTTVTDLLNGLLGTYKTFGKVNNSTNYTGAIYEVNQWNVFVTFTGFVGVVSKIISKTGNVYILEITLEGGTFTVLESELDTNFYINGPYTTGNMWLSAETALASVPAIYKSSNPAWEVNIPFATVIDNGAGELQISLATGISSFIQTLNTTDKIKSSISSLFNSDFQKIDYDNLLINANFHINQRGITLVNQQTIQTQRKIFNPLADRWFVVAKPADPTSSNPLATKPGTNTPEGVPLSNILDFSVEIMSDNNPWSRPLSNASITAFKNINRDYVRIKCDFTVPTPKYVDNTDANTASNTTNNNPNSSSFYRLENISNNLRSLVDPNFGSYSFGFRARIIGPPLPPSGITLNVIQNFYAEPSWYEIIKGATAWWSKVGYHTAKYEKIGTVNLDVLEGWKQYAIKGFNINPIFHTDKSLNLYREEEGWYSIGFEIPNIPGYTLDISEPILIRGDGFTGSNIHALTKYTSPEEDLEKCKKYYLRTYDWYQKTRETNRPWKKTYHQLQVGNLTTQKTYTIQYPITLTRRTATSINPITAVIYTLDGITGEAFNVNKNANMFIQGAGALQFENLPWQTSQITRSHLGQGQNITVSDVNAANMDLTINGGAVPFDTLQFHYVIDGDYDPQTTFRV